jgi:hypothetical protein
MTLIGCLRPRFLNKLPISLMSIVFFNVLEVLVESINVQNKVKKEHHNNDKIKDFYFILSHFGALFT